MYAHTMQTEMGTQHLSEGELRAAWESMGNDNAAMVDDLDNVLFI